MVFVTVFKQGRENRDFNYSLQTVTLKTNVDVIVSCQLLGLVSNSSISALCKYSQLIYNTVKDEVSSIFLINKI